MAKARYGIDPETGYALCKQGHVLSPDNVTSNHSCKVCQDLREKTRRQSEQYKAYRQSEKHKAYQEARRQSEEYRESQKAYRQSEKYKACAKKRRDSLVAYVVAGKLGIPVASAPPELIEIKRLTIQLGRVLKCQKQNNQLQQAA